MTDTTGFSIEISSRYDGWWRYNVSLMCGCFDADGNRTDFVGTQSHIADVGANLKTAPANAAQRDVIRLETPACDHILLYIYIVPHTLPEAREVGDTKPFQVALRITRTGRLLHSEKRQINPWSGASIELKVEN